MREHEFTYWQDQLLAAMTMTGTLEQDREAPVVRSPPGPRVLISQQMLAASRMLRYIPRLPAQLANWLQYGYGVAPDLTLHHALTLHLFGLEVASATPKPSKRDALFRLTEAAVLYARLARQSSAAANQITPAYLAELVECPHLDTDAWRRSRWAVRWRSLTDHINRLDRLAVEELVTLNKLIRQTQEVALGR